MSFWSRRIGGWGLAVSMLAACGGERAETSGTDRLTDDTGFLYVTRELVPGGQGMQLASVESQGEDLRSPYAYLPGARLMSQAGLRADARASEVLANHFGSGDYDVKDLSVSPDGGRVLFAAHGPESGDTWNIYEYHFGRNEVRRIIADDGRANAGHDTSPVYTDDGAIVFSSSRAAGNPAHGNVIDPADNADCYKVGPEEQPSLLHLMGPEGEEIVQLTYGNNHDVRTLALGDGRVAFVRWSRRYELLTEACPDGDELALFDTRGEAPQGLSRPPRWDGAEACAYAVATEHGPAVPSNHYALMTLDPDSGNLEQLYETVSLEHSDAIFISPERLQQAESGELLMLVRHRRSGYAGGDVLRLGAPGDAGDSQLFAALSPRSIFTQGVNLYPDQVSVAGWYSAVAPYQDGTGRLLVSWAQCLVDDQGVDRYCDPGAEQADGRYGIWVYDPATETRLPIVRAQRGKVFSDLALNKPQPRVAFPYAPVEPSVDQAPDANRIICDDPGVAPTPPEEDEPSESEPPGSPEEPAPTDPEEPINPGEPGEPTDPDNPTDPGEPSDPGEPGDPSDPDQPTVPDEPDGNRAPSANAGEHQSVSPGNRVQLDGSGSSDPDGDALTFHWVLSDKPETSVAELDDAGAVQPAFVADEQGRYVITLVVNDGELDSEPDQVLVDSHNVPPIADAGPDQSVRVGDRAQLDGSASRDADGDPLSYQWQLLSVPEGSEAVLDDPTLVRPRLDIDQPGDYVVELIVNDGYEDSQPDQVTLSTVNVRPIADAGPDQRAQVGDQVMLDGSGSYDPDGDALDFSWSFTYQPRDSDVELADRDSAYPLFAPTHSGLYVAQLIVNDGQLDSHPSLTRIKVSPEACDLSDEYQRTLPVIIRDFRDSHPDFEYRIREEQGLVEAELGEDGLPVYAGPRRGTYTTTGPDNFNQWYRDVPGVNYTLHKTLEIERLSGSTIWQYQNDAFFPIDDEGFGNEGRPHNYHFTLEARLAFDYEGGESFTFRGDDDLWVFINGRLALDIGGVHGVIERSISLDELADELGITPGNSYSFDLFFAERHTVESNFMFQTNINLECVID